jgi:diphthamide biosynthesis enzyme Dph1/Dph2-like protein
MKVLYIESRKKVSEPNNSSSLSNLIEKTPKKLHILYTIQYKELANQIYKELKKHKDIAGFEQALGCSIVKTKADSILFITDGRFHAVQIAYSSGKEVIIYNGHSFDKITAEEITSHERKEKGKLIKFYSSNSLGLLVSLKPGQEKLLEAEKFQVFLTKNYPHKKSYLFLAETLNLADLENFPIDSWVNFACPGISLDHGNIVNYIKIPQR